MTDQDQRGENEVIWAIVPLANLFGYTRTLASLTRGKASLKMEFSHYATVPPQNDPPFPPAMGMRA